VDLGYDPPQGALLLPVGGPFSAALESSVPWPAGMVIDLYFTGEGSPVTWAASISGTRAAWDKSIAQVAEILGSNRRTVALRGTPASGEPAPWYRLTVRPV
jgi:hypothetical protein